MKRLNKYTRIAIIAVLSLVITKNYLNAQFIDDALRYSQSNGLITPRAAGLNVAFYGISDDVSALMYNPAGMTLIGRNEISIGFGFNNNPIKSNFLNGNNVNSVLNNTTFSANDAYISHAGLISPIETRSDNRVAIGIGYFLENNFNGDIALNGFNKNNTMTAYEAANGPGSPYNGDPNINNNVAYHQWLASAQLVTPIKDSLFQSSFIQQSGGLRNIVGGAAFDLSPTVSLGLSLNGKWGTFRYTKDYTESDIYNKYSTFDTVTWKNLDFNNLKTNETLDQNISGITGSIGLMFKLKDFMRFSLVVKFPTYYDVQENFSYNAQSTFDNGWQPNAFVSSGTNSYKITTPFVYSTGVSLHALNMTFTAGASYSDVTQLRFSDAQVSIMNLNKSIVQDLVGQVTWGFGAEYKVPLVPIVARASFSSTTSPYAQDVGGASYNIFSIGGGIYLSSNVRLDAVFQYGSNTQLRSSYGNLATLGSSVYTINMKPLNIGAQITYRY